jgi:peroxin-4
MQFLTPICHPNVDFKDGSICLDLLADAWSPSWTISTTLSAIGYLLANPVPDSPLNVDAANLVRHDTLGYQSLVRYYMSLHHCF